MDGDGFETGFLSERDKAVARIAPEIAWTLVIGLKEWHRQDQVTARAQYADHLLQYRLHRPDMFEHGVAQNGLEPRILEGHSLQRPQNGSGQSRRDVIVCETVHTNLS